MAAQDGRGRGAPAQGGAAERSRVFEDHRSLLFAVAYDMLGSVHDAEDCVQETWLGWDRADRSGVAEPKAYLVRSVANRALNKVRSAAARRESYVGPWLPEPRSDEPDAAETAERAEEVSYALLVVLETLGPVERAVFVLREVFGLPFDEIAGIVDRSTAAVRQTAVRARRRVRERRPRHRPDRAEWRRLTEQFLAASARGDVAGLTALLSDGARVVTDGGGKRQAALRPITGAAKVARFIAGIAAEAGLLHESAFEAAEEAEIGGEPVILLRDAGGRVHSLCSVEVADGRITEIFVVRNPDKLVGFADRPRPGSEDAARS